MKLTYSFIFILLFSTLIGHAQTPPFEKIYGDTSYWDTGFTGRSVQQTTDGGYIVVGDSIEGGMVPHAYLFKTDSFGSLQWSKTFDWKVGRSVQQTTDGGYIVAGFLWTDINPSDFYVVKTNSSGDTLWTKTYGGPDDDIGLSARQTSDGGYVVVGTTSSYGSGSYDVYLIKTDASGDIVWTKTYGGSGADFGNSVEQTSDGGYIIGGYTSSFGAGSDDLYLIKINSTGDTLWTKTYGGTASDRGKSVKQTSDGGYIFTGLTQSFGAGSNDIYLIKANTSGDTLWTRTYGGSASDEGASVKQTSGGEYIITGSTQSYGSGSDDVYFIKTDSSGTILWSKTFGNSSSDKGNAVIEANDSSYVMTGNKGESAVLIKIYAPCQGNNIVISGETALCSSPSVQLTANGGSSYIWNTGATTSTISVSSPGTYEVYEISSGAACGDTLEVIQIENNQPQNICIVTVDTASNKNMVVWEETGDTAAIASYNIYKEGSTSGVYNLSGNVAKVNISTFIDTSSSPSQKADRYKVVTVDTCGLEYPVDSSSFHKTMHLTINKGQNSDWNLIWSAYEGFSFGTYDIWRGTSPNNLMKIGSVQSNLYSFTDQNAPSGTLYYMVEVEHSGGCNPSRAITSSRSNIASSTASAIEDIAVFENFNIYPNPVKNTLNITATGTTGMINIQLFNMLGAKVREKNIAKDVIEVDTENLPAGIYMLKVIYEESQAIFRVVKG